MTGSILYSLLSCYLYGALYSRRCCKIISLSINRLIFCAWKIFVYLLILDNLEWSSIFIYLTTDSFSGNTIIIRYYCWNGKCNITSSKGNILLFWSQICILANGVNSPAFFKYYPMYVLSMIDHDLGSQ